jgi:hypothetical protein
MGFFRSHRNGKALGLNLSQLGKPNVQNGAGWGEVIDTHSRSSAKPAMRIAIFLFSMAAALVIIYLVKM